MGTRTLCVALARIVGFVRTWFVLGCSRFVMVPSIADPFDFDGLNRIAMLGGVLNVILSIKLLKWRRRVMDSATVW